MPKIRPLTVRFFLVIIYIGVLAYLFWTSSRYPALNDKAIMEGTITTTGIGFDNWFPITPEMAWYEQVLYNTLNWIYTNKQGMTFGIMFATGLLMVFSLLKHKTFKNRFVNAGFGMLLGAPLGVCVNCAAPIAQGMRKGGASVETTLATMVSSPTLNVVVLGMLFSLFPWYMVAVKLILTLIFILALIPLLGKYLSPPIPINTGALQKLEDKSYASVSPILNTDLPKEDESIPETIKWFVVRWVKSFWYIIKTTLPLMLLAGVLGNVLISFLPWESLLAYLPSPEHSGILVISIAIFTLGVIGLFLPVPMAFDIIICAILIAAGIPEYYVMVLLFTLGIFSVYSFFIVHQAISFKIAFSMTAILILMGAIGGLATRNLGSWNTERELAALIEVMRSDIKGPETIEVDDSEEAYPQAELNLWLTSNELESNNFVSDKLPGNIKVEAFPFQPESEPSRDQFQKISGNDIGLGISRKYITDFMIVGKLSTAHSLASGDVHQDGRQDLAVVTNGNLLLFANIDGQFKRQQLPNLDSLSIVTVAMADMNDDSWLDLIITSEGKGNYYFLNDGGDFSNAEGNLLPNTPNAWLTRPIAFADYDRDNDLDIVFGNYSIANYNQINNGRFQFPVQSKNALLINEEGKYRLGELPTTIVGETLTLLWSDINGDGWMDLIEANDFAPPDVFYLNEEGKYNRSVKNSEGLFETSTKTTMSLISADINNDLQPEIYIGEIALMGLNDDEIFGIEGEQLRICSELSDPKDREACANFLNILITDREMNWQRKAALELGQVNFEFLILLNNMRRNKLTCDEIPAEWSFLSEHCNRIMDSEYNTPSKADINNSIPSRGLGENVLLVADAEGKFKNNGKELGIAKGGYTWNAKFADLNADEYLDLFIVNGSHVNNKRQDNFLYMNQKGEKFTNEIREYSALSSYLATQTYTYIDIDNDGDQDIITAPVIGPLQVHINQMKKGNSIAFELHDSIGNSYGIGSKIIIEYSEGQKKQIREILASGGHLSYDPYIAYFGLGEHEKIDKVIVQWSTGEETIIDSPFLYGSKYVIHRN